MEENNSIPQDMHTPEKVSKHMGTGIFVAVVMGVILLLYLGMSIFFKYHYFFHTTIAGVDYSLQSKQSVQEKVLDPDASFIVNLKGRENQTASLTTEHLNISYVFDDTLKNINDSQNMFAWPISLFKGSEYGLPVYVSYDKAELENELLELSIFQKENCKAPVDAYIGEYNEENNQYSIVIEEMGTFLQLDKTMACIEDAFKTFAFGQNEITIDLDAMDCYKNPSVYSDDSKLQTALDKINTFVSAKITYDWNGATEDVDGMLIHDWVTTKGTEATIDTESVSAYVEQMAKKNDTYGREKSFTTTTGNVLSLRSIRYGWKTDVEAETQALIEEIKKGEILKKEPIYQSKGYVKGQNDIGSSYVEINLTTQHLYLYERGSIIFETAFVSGNMSNGCATPAGVSGLTYKTKDATLKGENYETFVHYWMPFNGNIGLHDATWRNQFGGDIYLTNGSHGCVNLPLSSAEYLYNYLCEGFPIICYYE